MTVYRIRIEASPTLAISVATVLADADGVDLISSEPPATVPENMVELRVAVDGARDAVARAVASIRDGLPMGAAIEIADD